MDRLKDVKVGMLVKTKRRTLGIIRKWDIICAGHVMELHIHPLVNPLVHILGSLVGAWRFVDNEIDSLTPVV